MSSVSPANNPIWVGLVADSAGSGSAIFYDPASTGGGDAEELFRINAPAGETVPPVGPFFPENGLEVGSIENASAIIWSRPE